MRFRTGPGVDIKSIKINTERDNHDLIGDWITLSGWGYTEKSPAHFVYDLMKADQLLEETTATLHGHVINQERLLQGGQLLGVAGCFGDSGGKRIRSSFCNL